MTVCPIPIKEKLRLDRFRVPGLMAFVCALFLGFVLFVECSLDTGGPMTNDSSDSIRFVIPQGASTHQVAVSLRDRGVIRSVTLFKFFAKLMRADGRLQAGEYSLDRRLSMMDILRKFKRGEVVRVLLTVPEGWTAEQIARLVEEKGLGRKGAFLEAARDPRVIPQFVPRRGDLLVLGEGYLFPDTYLIPKGLSESQIVGLMVNEFLSVFDDSRREKARRMGLSVHEVVTLASIIEKEANTDTERSLVSAVFHNRLKKGWRLEADPTVKYVLPNPPEFLSKKDLKINSPYNTYLFEGLPPGPIANPGLRAIDAALNPAEVDYMFFVAKGDGSHQFSRTYSEHLEAKRRAEEMRSR